MLINSNAVQLPMADESIHVMFCSPPYYGLRVYEGLEPQVWGGRLDCTHEWDAQPNVESSTCKLCGAWLGHLGNEPILQLYVAHLVEAGQEIRRVLRSDGVWFLNLGDSYANDTKWGGTLWGKNYTSAHHSLYQGQRSRTHTGLKPKDKILMPHRIALALQEDGWYVRQDMQWIKRNGLPESVGDRPVVTHEYVFMLTKLPTYHWDAEAVKRPSAQASLDMVAQATFASQSGGDKDSRNHRSSRKALEGFAKNPGARQFRSTDPWLDSLDDEIRQVSERLVHLQAIRDEGGLLLTPDGEPLAIRTVTWPYKGSHFATFPPVLIRDLIRGATSEGGCCPACGKQYERVVEKQKTERGQTERSSDDGYVNGKSTARSLAEKRQAYRRLGREGPPSTRTIGFRPTCDCNAGAPIPPIVCDPFCGTGTVGQVCRELGLRFIGIDLSAEYLARHASIRAEGKTMVAALREAKERLRESYAREPDELEASSDGQLALF